MRSNKREVWEFAKEIGIDGFIESVSRAFPGAISDVCVGDGNKVLSTDGKTNLAPINGICVEAKLDKSAIKSARAQKNTKRLK